MLYTLSKLRLILWVEIRLARKARFARLPRQIRFNHDLCGRGVAIFLWERATMTDKKKERGRKFCVAAQWSI